MVKMEDIVARVREAMDLGIWNPDEIYVLVQQDFPETHYSQIRKAIHLAKVK